MDNLFAHFGDLLAWYPDLRVIQRVEDRGHEILLLRAGDTPAPATTLFVESETGRVRRVERVATLQGMGRVGTRTTYGDFRDVSGMLLPFRSQTEVANPFVGAIVVTVTGIELGVALPEGGFELGDN